VDDLGYLSFDARGAELLYQVFNRRYQRASTSDRSGTVEDPFGHVWTLSTHVEDVSPDEMRKRMAAM
jgi:uncharacterized glyoxalase superfamily protein PhnB